jgi:hypothetical protein
MRAAWLEASSISKVAETVRSPFFEIALVFMRLDHVASTGTFILVSLPDAFFGRSVFSEFDDRESAPHHGQSA